MSIFIAMDLSPVHIYFKFEICPRSNQVTLNHSAPKVVQLEWTTCLGAFVRQAFQHDSLDLRYLKKNLRTPAARLRIGIRIKVGAGHPWSQLVTPGHSWSQPMPRYAKPHLMMYALQEEKRPADQVGDGKAHCPRPYHPALPINYQTRSWSFNVFYAFLTSHPIKSFHRKFDVGCKGAEMTPLTYTSKRE